MKGHSRSFPGRVQRFLCNTYHPFSSKIKLFFVIGSIVVSLFWFNARTKEREDGLDSKTQAFTKGDQSQQARMAQKRNEGSIGGQKGKGFVDELFILEDNLEPGCPSFLEVGPDSLLVAWAAVKTKRLDSGINLRDSKIVYEVYLMPFLDENDAGGGDNLQQESLVENFILAYRGGKTSASLRGLDPLTYYNVTVRALVTQGEEASVSKESRTENERESGKAIPREKKSETRFMASPLTCFKGMMTQGVDNLLANPSFERRGRQFIRHPYDSNYRDLENPGGLSHFPAFWHSMMAPMGVCPHVAVSGKQSLCFYAPNEK